MSHAPHPLAGPPPAEAADPAAAAWRRRDTRHHDREAARYDALIGREFAVYEARWAAGDWARRLAADGARVVLDVGAGTGRVAMPVAARGTAVIAADLSRGMLERARAKAAAAGLPVWPVIADAERLPLADAALDGVVGSGVLHHVPDVERALAEAARVARAGAWLCFAEPGAEASALYRAVRAVTARLGSVARPLRRLNSPAAADERPLAPAALVDALARHVGSVEAAYLTHLPIVYRFLPSAVTARLAGWINAGDRATPRPADIVIVRGRRAAGAP